MSFWDNLTGKTAQRAAEENKRLIAQHQADSTGFLDRGFAGASGALNEAAGAYGPLAALGQKYGLGTDLYLDALGTGGAAGTQRAQDAFTAGPGYQWQVDQGMDAINRRRAAGGMLNSGNADLDALTYGQGLAKQEYSGWLDRLGGMISPELAATSGAASGVAGANTNLANLYQTDATSRVGLSGNVASGTADANNMSAQAGMAGASNLLGLGMNLASLALPGIGTLAGGIGGGLGALGSQFGMNALGRGG